MKKNKTKLSKKTSATTRTVAVDLDPVSARMFKIKAAMSGKTMASLLRLWVATWLGETA